MITCLKIADYALSWIFFLTLPYTISENTLFVKKISSLVIKMSIKQTFFSNYGKKWMEKLRTSQLVHSYNKLFNITNTGHLLANLITKRDFGAKQTGIWFDWKNVLTLSLTCKSAPLSSNFVTTSKESFPAASWRGVLSFCKINSVQIHITICSLTNFI